MPLQESQNQIASKRKILQVLKLNRWVIINKMLMVCLQLLLLLQELREELIKIKMTRDMEKMYLVGTIEHLICKLKKAFNFQNLT